MEINWKFELQQNKWKFGRIGVLEFYYATEAVQSVGVFVEKIYVTLITMTWLLQNN